MKTAHLRNLYTRIGMFGMANTWLVVDEDLPGNSHEHMGDQVRGYGFTHDGIYDTIHRFVLSEIFSNTGFRASGFENDQQRRDVEQYLLAFDSDLAPIVGQQVTLDASNVDVAGTRIDLLVARAGTPFTSEILGGDVTECDLVAHGSTDGEAWGRLFNPETGTFTADRTGEPILTDAELRAAVSGTEDAITYTCVPSDSGHRIALDRDLDGVLNRDDETSSDRVSIYLPMSHR